MTTTDFLNKNPMHFLCASDFFYISFAPAWGRLSAPRLCSLWGRAVPADVLTARALPDKPEETASAAPAKPPRKWHRVRNALIFLLVLALAAFAAAWYYTSGDLTALPQRLQSLGADSLPHAGAKLI